MSRLKQLGLWAVTASLVATTAFAGAPAENSGTLSVGSATANPGDTNVEINISASTTSNSVIGGTTGLTFTILFDVNLCPHLTNLDAANAGRTTGTAELSGMGCPTIGSAMFNISGTPGEVILPDGDGNIITWSFDLGNGAPTGVFPLTLDSVSAFSGPVQMTIETSNGQLNIEDQGGPTSTATATATNTTPPENTATPTATATATDTPTDGPTSTPPPTNTPSNTPENTATNTATATVTDTPTDGPTSTPTATATATATATDTNTPEDTATSTQTPTSTNTFTPSNTPTNTPIPAPNITGGATDGSSNVNGTAAAGANVEIRTVPGGEVLGSATAGGDGRFFVSLNRPLSAPEVIQPFDTTNGLPGNEVGVTAPPAEIPAVDPFGAALLISLLAAGMLWRVRGRLRA